MHFIEEFRLRYNERTFFQIFVLFFHGLSRVLRFTEVIPFISNISAQYKIWREKKRERENEKFLNISASHDSKIFY